MNKAIPTALALMAAAASASAQGTLSLNTATGTKPRIAPYGGFARPEDNIWVEVLVPGATSLSGLGAEPFQLTLTGANAGLFSKGILTVNGIPGGTAVNVVFRIWDKDAGATYDDVRFDEGGNGLGSISVISGLVLGGVLDSNGIAGLPASIVPGFEFLGFPIPEPSTYALAAFGLGGLIYLRRK